MNKKVLLGMSGGVDSCVSAILLKKQGYDVTGITMRLWETPEKSNSEEYGSFIDNDAKKVCQELGIIHHTMSFKDEFKEKVVNNFICEYSNCRTPNPCIECNKYLKFGKMYEKAEELGIGYIATGHYAITEYSGKYNRVILKKAKNTKKDQSYVLYTVTRNILERVIFPLGNCTSKDEVREIAREYGFNVANKPDSEDICFVPDGDYKKFLENNSELKPKPGNIVNSKGQILGRHDGLYNYTIGQRKGLGISYRVPLFVIGFDKQNNVVIVGEEADIYRKEMYVDNINLLLIEELKEKMKVGVKIRYSSKEEKATIEMVDNDLIKVVFENPVARITPGQSAVFYIDDIVVGGGKIRYS